jgi:hypothetical protein
MARPINPYQGPAPASIGMMGQGLIEAGANIGRSIQGGYQALGQGLASGITAAAQAYGDYKKMQSGIKASEKAYDTFKDFLDPQVRSSIDQKIEGINKDTSLSMQDKAAFWEQAKGFIGGSVNQTYALDKQQKMINALAARQAAEARRPAPQTGSTFGGVPTVDQIFNAPMGQPQITGEPSRLPMNPSQGNPAPLMQGQPASRMTPDGRMEVWSSRLNKYVEIDNPMQDIQY